MFSRVILRRNDPASGRSSPDDIENQPLSPRADPSDSPESEMAERQQSGFSRLGIRRPSVPSRFRFSSSTQATSANGTEWPGTRTARASRSNTHPVPRPSSSHYPEEDDDEDLERQHGPRDSTLPSRYSIIVDLPSTRLHLPMLQRTWTQGSNGPPTSRPLPHEIHPALRPSADEPCRPTGPSVPTVMVTEPAPVARPTGPSSRFGSDSTGQLFGEIGRPRGGDGFHAPDPAESSLADLAGDGRRRRRPRDRSGSDRSRRHRHRRHRDRLEVPGSSHGGSSESSRRRRRRRIRDVEDGDSEGSDRPHPKHFLFCFPWIKSRKVRSQILQCFVSGTFLVTLLAVYLALSLTKNINNSEFTVLLILIILFATIFFCQGLIRLCLLILRPKRPEEQRRNGLAQMYGPGGYAIPRQPIRVVLARDEEAAGIESETTKINPPAYGLWRESVRVDPNRIYWERNTEAPPIPGEQHEMSGASSTDDDEDTATSGDEGSSRPRNVRRPPSYASEDGVAYVIEAQPRSIAPTGEVPLPVHPSEAGRVAAAPQF
ncbi:hypothetical protein N8I77_002566 [Diaporthe amygdali]|uniref:Uncharacterized protein n=1 Tax=Phomopsis amygdali TaxID=1214568 RepID=A0AAD9W9D5_PHOAM|nr:hypothetical protein N8I77_002566 [Diaporthe amygdali]